jgi:antitoxin component YwqK of YwqJK toxin-antitoxin module
MMSCDQSAPSGSQLLQSLGLDHEQYQALVEDAREYCETRDKILIRAKGWLQSTRALGDGTTSSGVAPFVIDDGESSFALLGEDGVAVPLPYGFELRDADINLPDDAVIFSTIGPTSGSVVRLIPVLKSFSLPDADDFALEHQLANELSKFDFEGLTVQEDVYSDAESGDLYTGNAVLHWPDGSLRKEANFIDGMLDTQMIWWYQNGQKELEDHYVANLRHGTHRAWHDNGQLMAQGESTHGQRQGSWRWWHDNGQLAEETVYVDNEPLQKNTFWYDSGAKKLKTSYQEGLEHGTQTTWFENGQRNTQLDFQNGVANGVLSYRYENGVQAGEIHIVDGEKHGLERRWDEAGELIEERNWSCGEGQDS